MRSKKIKNKPTFIVEKNSIWKSIGNLPVTAGVAMATFGTICVVLLLLESFRTNLILGIGIPVSILTFIFVNRLITPESPGSLRERRIVDVIAILLIIGWGIFNSAYNAQTVYLYRDPGLYNSTARWLIDNDNINIPVINPFGENDQLTAASNSGVSTIPENQERLYTHGQRLLPALTATVGRVTQESAALKTNVAIGAIALLALYGFTRLFTRPRWALLTTAVISLSLPMLYFSRDTYSEPISMLFFFSSLSLLYYAKKNENSYLWFASGVMAGVFTMTRIDAYLGLAGIFLYFSIYLALASKKQRKNGLKNTAMFAVGLIFTGVVAWLDLTQLGTFYFRFHENLIYQQLLLITGITILGFIACILFWKFNIHKKLGKKKYIKLFTVLSIVFIILSVVFLFLRPLIIKDTSYYELQNIAGTQSIVAQDTLTDNSIIHNVGERVILWPSWYLGTLFCFIGFIGLLLTVKKVWTDKSLLLIPITLSFLTVAIIYFFKPSITPDHIWASRRILPVIMTGIAFFVAIVLDRVNFSSRVYSILLYIFMTILFIFPAIDTSSFFVKEKENEALLTQVNQFCDILPANSAVLLIGHFGLVGTQTVSSYCQVPTVRFVGDRELTDEDYTGIYDNATKNGYKTIVASFYNDRPLFPEGSLVKDLDKYEYKMTEKVFENYPKKMLTGSKQIVYGTLQINESSPRVGSDEN